MRRGRPTVAEKWRVLDMALGKRVSYPKRDARAATRAAIKAWVIDTTETRAANLAERARRAAEQAAAVEAAAATAISGSVKKGHNGHGRSAASRQRRNEMKVEKRRAREKASEAEGALVGSEPN